MAIEFDYSFKSFRVSDTLHQLVDRLNDNYYAIENNTILTDSALNGLLEVVHADSGTITAHEDLTVTADNVLFDLDSDLTFNANSETHVLTQDLTVEAGRTISLQSESPIANVVLKSSGTAYGGLRNNNSSLEILSGARRGITFQDQNMTVYGTIEIPAAGVNTTSNTVSGAINELLAVIEDNMDTVTDRIDDLETEVDHNKVTIELHDVKLNDHDTRISALELLNIENRLLKVEQQIVAINERLGLLEI